MSWEASRRGKYLDVSGPVGDTLAINITSSSTQFTWTGWTWTGYVRQTPTGSNVSTFSITDNSTSSLLNITAKVVDTTGWTSRDAMTYRIKGTKGGETYTFLSGNVVPSDT